jgi:putative flippase GtrA
VLCFAFAGGLLGRGLAFWLTSASFMFAAIFVFRVMDEDASHWRIAASSAGIAIVAALVIRYVFQDLFLVRLP